MTVATTTSEDLRKFRVTLKDPGSDQKRFVSLMASSSDEAAATCEAMEKHYAGYRLDDPETLRRYPMLAPDTLEQMAESVKQGHLLHVPKDADVGGRFIRGGKVLGLNKQQRGQYHIHLQENPYKILEVGPSDMQAVVTGGLFGVPQKNQWDATTTAIDWLTATIKTALSTSTYTVDIDTHDFFNDVTNEITGTGYTAGGVTLGSKTATYDTATDQARFDAGDAAWTTATITARIATTYKSTGTASTSPLISFLNFGADFTSTAATFQITWDVTGVWVIDVT
jgi:hypothetical protein